MTLDKLKEYCRRNKRPPHSVVVVGFSKSYALEVHERTDVQRRVGGPKFLEKAARENESKVKEMIRRASIEQLPETLLKCGLLIQREAQKITPVDTSALRASAFTTLEEDLDRVATEARTRAQAIMNSVMAQREAKK